MRFMLVLLTLLFAAPLLAQEPPRRRPKERPEVTPKETPKEAPKEEEKPAPTVEEGTFALVNATVYPITSGVIRAGTILVRGGKIAAVGSRVELPADCPTIDVAGHPVLPGFVAARIQGIGHGRVTGKIVDSLDPFDREVELALAAGVTTGFTSSGSTSAVIKMTAGTLDGMLVREPAAETLSWGRADASARQSIVDRFESAKKHLAALDAYEKAKAGGDDKSKAPKKPGGIDPYLRLLKGETPARFTGARSASDVRDCLALVDRYRFRAILEGALEAWRVGEEIARRGVRVIDQPRRVSTPDPRTNEPVVTTTSSSAILRSKGVRFAIMPPGGRRGGGGGISLGGIVGRDLFTLTFDAARAVSGGLSEAAALEAITIDAAEILGVDDRVGSIEVGKDADLILMSGDPLDYRTWVLKAWVNGRQAYDKSKSRLLSEVPVR